MTVPSFGNIAAQLQSGYVPPGYWLYPVTVLAANALAVLVIIGMIRWWQGTGLILIATDVTVLVASWSFLIPFVFSNDWPLVTWILSPLTLVLAWRVPLFALQDRVTFPPAE
jgi:hypothetical protein